MSTRTCTYILLGDKTRVPMFYFLSIIVYVSLIQVEPTCCYGLDIRYIVYIMALLFTVGGTI